jgi:ubiquinone/menaquinone biosynthesis C-methylase UbiE
MAETITQEQIKAIQEKNVGMYSKHPWPVNRRTAEEMGWRLKVLGIHPSEFQGKRTLECGCGTGNYVIWYAMEGQASEAVGVDLSDGSLAVANRLKEEGQVENATFKKMDVLKLDFPDNSFDYSYSYGVFMITGDSEGAYQEMVRVTKPGGTITVSVYNTFGRWPVTIRQKIIKRMAPDDPDKRVQLGVKYFPGPFKKLDKRYYEINSEQLAYDTYGIPYEEVHSAGAVLGWLKRANVKYKGSFAPLRIRDYSYAFSLDEYKDFRSTFAGYPAAQKVSDLLFKISRKEKQTEYKTQFTSPGPFSRGLCQLLWLLIGGSRFSCFTISGVKQK